MKTNKLFILFLILVFLLSGIVYADDIDLEKDSSIETISPQDTIPSINSRAAIVYDRNSGMILYGKNENEKSNGSDACRNDAGIYGRMWNRCTGRF